MSTTSVLSPARDASTGQAGSLGADSAGLPAEQGPLATEMVSAYRRMMDYYQRRCGLTAQEAAAKLDADGPAFRDVALNGDPNEIEWAHLQALQEVDPDAAARRWEQIKALALDELRSGHRAGKAFETTGSDPWQRARFLAVRQELTEDWKPRNGIERALIDTMAQAHSCYLHWMDTLMARSALDSESHAPAAKERGTWQAPRVTSHEAIEQAAVMVDRFQRMFTRALRSLRDLRRYTPTIVFQHADNVNVGDSHVNITGGP